MEIGDFEVILRNNFFILTYVGVLSHLGGVMVMYGGNACFVRGYNKPTGVGDPKTNEG